MIASFFDAKCIEDPFLNHFSRRGGIVNDVPLSTITLLELGISLSPTPDTSPELLDRKSAYLPAIPDTVPGANRLIADAIARAALVDPNPDREAARTEMRTRLVREKNGRPHIANLVFYGVEQPNGDVHITTRATLPGYDTEQEITPLIYVGAEYLTPIGNGKFASGGTLQCLVFKPKQKKQKKQTEEKSQTKSPATEMETGRLKAFPLGLADPSTIHVWNDVARRRNAVTKDKEDLWPLIDVIRNNLMRPGVRTIEFVPTFDPAFMRDRKSRKRLLVGTRFGQKLYLAPKSQIPEPDEVNGEKCFQKKHVFRVKLSESSLEVYWLGKEGSFKIDQRLAVLDVHDAINPYAVLNTSPLKADWKTIDHVARGYLNRPFDNKNPLYLAGLEMKLIFPGDPIPTMHAILEDLMLDAIAQIKLQIAAASTQMIRMLTIAPNKPSSEALLAGKDVRIAAYRLNQPEDAAATWISRVLDMPFDPKSPLLMHLRSWLINTHAHAPVAATSEPSQISFQIPELTPAPKSYQLPPPQPARRHESSHPEFRPNDSFSPVASEDNPQTDEEEVLLADGDLEELSFPDTSDS